MNPFDITALILIGVSGLRVAFRGFVREVATLLWLIVGILAGVLFSGLVGRMLEVWFVLGVFNQIIAFILIFLVVFLIIKLLSTAIEEALDRMNLESLDAFLGFLLGAVEGILIVFLLFLFLDFQPVWPIHAELRASVAFQILQPFLPYARALVPGMPMEGI